MADYFAIFGFVVVPYVICLGSIFVRSRCCRVHEARLRHTTYLTEGLASLWLGFIHVWSAVVVPGSIGTWVLAGIFIWNATAAFYKWWNDDDFKKRRRRLRKRLSERVKAQLRLPEPAPAGA